MSTVYSDQRANDVAVPPVLNKPNVHGKVLRSYFSLNTTDHPINNGDVVELCRVPAGARIQEGYIIYGAMGASATAIIGIAGSTSKYLTSTDVSALGGGGFAHTAALNYGVETTAEETIILTAGGADYASGKDIKGYVQYISAGE